MTQQQIDEIRLGPEKEMLSDLKRRYAAGDDLQALDVQGAAPVSCLLIIVTRRGTVILHTEGHFVLLYSSS